MQRIRCAIYTRKSSEDGLEQEFNSLHAQREACAAYIASQKAEGWVLLLAQYDDGGLSGGTLERPAMQQLLADVDAGLVDQIVVYKIDRLTRSLADFAKIVERLDAAGASFVSVTQSFNTATSMGRLTLNMLLSFAQFEREVTAERIRDKIAASKRKGLWMGGYVPLGYEADGRTLRINPEEAKTIRTLYDLYRSLGTIRATREEAGRLGLQSKVRTVADGRMQGGIPFDRGHIHYILTNPLYAGRIRHRNEVHEGQHPAIIDPEVWDVVQAQLTADSAKPRRAIGARTDNPVSLLVGKLFDETGDRLTPSHTKTRQGRRLRYYVSHRLIRKSGEAGVSGWRLPAGELEHRVTELVSSRLTDPTAAAALLPGASADNIEAAARCLAAFEAESRETGALSKLLGLLERTDIAPGELTVRLSADAIAGRLGVAADDLDRKALVIAVPFRMRKRGVETRLILGNASKPKEVDRTLLTNVARGWSWFGRLTSGDTYDAIARAEGVPKDRVVKLIDLALLSPDIIGQVIAGTQPAGLTTEYLIRNRFPGDWDEQERLFARLS